MQALCSFFITLPLIATVTWRGRIPPFLALVGGGVLYGLIAGMDGAAIVDAIADGAGSVFAVLGIVIFCGALISSSLEEAGHLDRIIADIRHLVQWPAASAGLAGFLLSIPLMCCITAFIILHPVISRFDTGIRRHNLLFVTAVASVVSSVLIYPAPVMLTALNLMDLSIDNPWSINTFTIPLALTILAAVVSAASVKTRFKRPSIPDNDRASGSLHAWLPFTAIFICIITGLLVPGAAILSTPSIALLAGGVSAIMITPSKLRHEVFSRGSKRAGVIIFDIAGAGAYGGVIAASDFPAQMAEGMISFIPPYVIPFVLAAVIEAAVGSRVVTASIVAVILGGWGGLTGINPAGTLLMIAGGCCIFPAFSDPYFWLLKRLTGAEIRDVFCKFTIPLTIIGTFVGGLGAAVAALF